MTYHSYASTPQLSGTCPGCDIAGFVPELVTVTSLHFVVGGLGTQVVGHPHIQCSRPPCWRSRARIHVVDPITAGRAEQLR